MTRNNDGALRNGAHVEIHGLQNATHLNGKTGRLKSLHREGAHAGRWAVRVDGVNHAVKPENLRLVEPPPTPQQAAPPAIQESASSRRTRDNIRSSNSNRSHRNTAPSIQAVPAGSFVNSNPRNDAWANGLSVQEQYEWLSNCYQMRCDDDYVYGGCNLHGPYNPEATPESITMDFMTFCLLAKRGKCIPGGWKWQEFLLKAAGFVVFALEKSDAQERWGSENVFSAMMGGRSLRYTAELVYGSSCQEQEESPQAVRAMQEAERPSEAIYNEIGGRNVWNLFQRELAGTRRFS